MRITQGLLHEWIIALDDVVGTLRNEQARSGITEEQSGLDFAALRSMRDYLQELHNVAGSNEDAEAETLAAMGLLQLATGLMIEVEEKTGERLRPRVSHVIAELSLCWKHARDLDVGPDLGTRYWWESFEPRLAVEGDI